MGTMIVEAWTTFWFNCARSCNCSVDEYPRFASSLARGVVQRMQTNAVLVGAG